MAAEDSPPIVKGVRISHPDRVLYPDQGITKLELARYLEQAAEWMLPHIENRLVSLVRCPEGRQKKCFFQRHAGAGLGGGFYELEVKDMPVTVAVDTNGENIHKVATIIPVTYSN